MRWRPAARWPRPDRRRTPHRPGRRWLRPSAARRAPRWPAAPARPARSSGSAATRGRTCLVPSTGRACCPGGRHPRLDWPGAAAPSVFPGTRPGWRNSGPIDRGRRWSTPRRRHHRGPATARG
ncbi:hypothetical protein AZA_90576 [Nitrospirillum viridazoti Y2]|nr:hypothetical protein AZA_90576 [Nitrospirillum amazonense Y2]